MLLTKPRRKLIYATSWTMLAVGISCFVSFHLRIEPGKSSFSPVRVDDSFLRIGLFDWLWFRGQTPWLPSSTLAFESWSAQVVWTGLLGTVCAVLLVAWLCFRGWRSMVEGETSRGSICDSCQYDLRGSKDGKCPECGDEPVDGTVSRADWVWAVGSMFFGLMMVGMGLISPVLAAGYFFPGQFDLGAAMFYILFAPTLLLVSWVVVGAPWMHSGRPGFDDERDSPLRRRLICGGAAWVPTGVVLILMLCEALLMLVDAARYGDLESARSLRGWLPFSVAYAGLAHPIMLWRIRRAARRAGICVKCGGEEIESPHDLCCRCRP